jgi:cytoskeleton protein RodZ
MSIESFAAELKSAREKQSVPLRQIADATRISLRHLESIETGHFDRLPGGIYNRVFLRSYCEYLGLEPEEMLARYDAETAPPTDKGAKSKNLPSAVGRGVPPIAIWTTMLAASIAGLFLSRGRVSALFSPYFAQRAPAPPAARRAAPEPPPQSSPTGATSATPPNSLAVLPPAEPAAPPAATVAPSRAAESSARPAGASSRSAPDVLRLEIEVIARSWVLVTSDGNRALVKLLEPGDRQWFEASERFYLKVGNAAGLKLKINGKRAKPLGSSGEVATVVIDRRNLGTLLESNPVR